MLCGLPHHAYVWVLPPSPAAELTAALLLFMAAL